MQKQKPHRDEPKDLHLIEEISRRTFLRDTSIKALGLTMLGRSLSIARSRRPRIERGSAQKKVFEGVFELEGGGELLMTTLPDGRVRGSRDGGRIQLEGRVSDNTLVYRWWTTGQRNVGYMQAPPSERGKGHVSFKPPDTLTGFEGIEGEPASSTWSARKKPELYGILSANQPFIGVWTNGRDFLGFSQHFDGGLTGVHTSAKGVKTYLKGFERDSRLEYRWWIPRHPKDTFNRVPGNMRGSGFISIRDDGRLLNEWTADTPRPVRRTDVLEKVKGLDSKRGVVNELDDNSFGPFIKGNRKAVVDFGAPWCGPCKKIEPLFEQLAQQHRDIAFGKINVDVAQRTKKMFNVTGIPHIIFFVDGRVVRKITGSNSEALINAVTSL